MNRDRLLYTRAAKVRIDMLPVEVRVHLETHLENLAVRNGLEQDGTRRDAARYRLLSIPGGYEVRARFC